jgi:hypothetical protein
MQLITLRNLTAATLLLGSLACSDPITPESLAGEYNLVSADGSSIPATIATSDTLVVTEVTGGRLVLLANQNYSLFVDFRITNPQQPGNPTTERFTDVGPYTFGEGLLMFESTTPGTTWFGEVDGTEITVGIGEPDFLLGRLDVTFRKQSGG